MRIIHYSPLTNHHSRLPKGVVLLVILGMLAALALIGIAFTTFSAQEENSSENFRLAQQTPRVDVRPEVLFQEALSQLIADSHNPHSAIRGHSLLRRMYGNNNDINGNGVIDVAEYFLNPFDGPGDLGDTSTTPATPIDFNFVYNARPPEYVWDVGSTSWRRGGGFDVDYTYPDHQNMYLAAIRADGTVLVPSFHRPGYLAASGSDWTSSVNSAGQGRRIILRPRQADHSATFPFVGAPAAPTATDVYDVDNMGLGRTDSVWVDLGYPVLQTQGGRRFKPMFAFLVMDMDGKLNLNAHGNLLADKMTDSSGAFTFPAASADSPSIPDSHADIAPIALLPSGPPAPDSDLALGSGWTPSEVNLQNVFSPNFFANFYPPIGSHDPREYAWLLQGRPQGVGFVPFNMTATGRWGEPELLPAFTWPPPNPPRAGATYKVGLFNNNVADDDALYSPNPAPGKFEEGKAASSSGRYGTPPDFDGTGGLAVDVLGNPQYWPRPDQNGPNYNGWGGSTGWTGLVPGAAGPYQRFPENIDEASEINLASRKSPDDPFTPRDLELLYRYHDIDSSNLPSRLRMLAPSLFDLSLDPINALRRRFMLTTESWDLIRFNRVPLLASSSTAPAGTPDPKYGNGMFPFIRDPVFRASLPESILAGRRLNLSPRLTTLAEKQEFAKNLYLLMYANLPQAGGPVSDAQAKRIAQWAINVADSCDAENGVAGIEEGMTPFVYDNHPRIDSDGNGTGWDVTNINPDDPSNIGSTEVSVVWGAEKPRLFITETLSYEDPAGTRNLWIELYNPTAYDVELVGPASKNSYQLVIDTPGAAGAADPYSDGPNISTLEMRFNSPMAGSSTTVPAGGILVVGPAGSIPGSLGVGPAASARYTPMTPFEPGTDGAFRVYLRRLSDPTQDAAPMPPADTYPNSSNPYITVDALDAFCYDNATFTTTPDIVVSRERESFSVKYLNHVPGIMGAGPTHTMGTYPNSNTPAGPWPMFPFNDRPLASSMELLLVPAVGPQHITTTHYRTMPATLNLYNPGGDVDATFIQTGVARTAPCKEIDDYLVGHLLNFFHETPGAMDPTPGYYRLFEYVEAPSRMNGTWDPNTQLPSATPGNDSIGRQRVDRVPGRMNINTIWEQESFAARFNNHPAVLDPNALTAPPGPAASPAWIVGTGLPLVGAIPTVAPSGTIYGTATSEPLSATVTSEIWRRVLMSIANPTSLDGSPAGTLFTPDDMPFRSFAVGTNGPPGTGPLPSPSIHSTLLRGLSAGVGAPTMPVFADTRTVPPPGINIGTTGAPTNLDDYPFFKYQLLQKMSNTFTTRSNVFAVWVTVGFFEVQSDDPTRLIAYGVANAPPQLGAEINADIGQNIRHRAFFIIDRSQARGYTGPPRNSAELQDILGQVVIHSRIIE